MIKKEGRGVWHRPVEKTLDEIRALLDSLASARFNQIYLETFYNGSTVFPPYGLIAGWHMDYEYGAYGRDYFKAFISEAMLRGLRVFAWIEVFMISEYGDRPEKKPLILDRNPQWINKNADGSTVAKYEGGKYLFLDPAVKEVREYIISIARYILVNYPDIAGFNVDYIRYPVSRGGDDSGYGDKSIQAFWGDRSGEVPSRQGFIEMLKRDDSLYRDWILFKAGNVTSMMEDFRKLVLSFGSEGGFRPLLTTAIFPQTPKTAEISEIDDEDIETLSVKNQFWLNWIRRGMIDVVTPMIYSDEVREVCDQSEEFIRAVGSDSYVYIGLIPTFHYDSHEERESHCDNYRLQIDAAMKSGADGTAVFASGQIAHHKRSIGVLRNTVYREEALAPDSIFNE